jgi:hypothetical protein
MAEMDHAAIAREIAAKQGQNGYVLTYSDRPSTNFMTGEAHTHLRFQSRSRAGTPDKIMWSMSDDEMRQEIRRKLYWMPGVLFAEDIKDHDVEGVLATLKTLTAP